MEAQVLGSLVLRNRDECALPSAPKPRQVLALLMLNANRTVPVPSLITELWDDQAPKSTMTTLQTYIMQIRKSIARACGITPGQVAREIITTTTGGYRFHIDNGDLDVYQYERLVSRGRHLLATGDNVLAAKVLQEALEIWRDRALVDVRPGPLLRAQIMRLEESRLGALECRIEADLRLGLHREVLSELKGLTAANPLDETLAAQLMVALCRSGRRSQALDEYQRLREALREDLGLEPSARLQQLQRAILMSHPAVDSVEHGGALLLFSGQAIAV
jgi:DNA-binding SARP family transcriptional activator